METMADDAMKMYVSVIKNEKINEVVNSEFDTIQEYLNAVPEPEKGGRHYDVMISGYYGFDNSGDDAILKAIISNLRELKPDIKVLALSNNPNETSQLYDVDSVHRFNIPKICYHMKKTSLLISGGGSLIQDVTSDKSLAYYLTIINLAHKMGTKVMLYSNGIGPILNKRNYAKIRQTLNRAECITLRENSSLEELERIGVSNPNTMVTADPAFTLQPAGDDIVDNILKSCGIESGEDFACVAVRPWKTIGREFEEALAESARHLRKRHGLKVLFVPMQCPKDADITNRIAARGGEGSAAAPENMSPAEILGIAGRAKLVIGMRLHTLIYAARVATPIIGLIYDPKVSAIMDYIGQGSCLPVESLNPITLNRMIDEVMANHDEISAALRLAADKAAELAKANAKKAIEIIRSSREAGLPPKAV